MAARILIADDDAQIVRLVRSYLEQAGYGVLTAADGDQALHIIRRDRPDLVVLDVMMPRHDGFELTRLLRADESLATLPILMLTARVEDADKLKGLNMGADDYLTKPFNPYEVVARVRALLRRASGTLQTSSLLHVRGLTLDLQAHSASVDDRPIQLTPTEYELLRALMQNTNRAFTRTELISAAFGYMYEGFDRTIDSHIKNLRKKVESDPTAPTYIETVFGVGYRMRE
jgi:two-component system, OmpR family, alkaline phosphatase synthesis response regulator PhoP